MSNEKIRYKTWITILPIASITFMLVILLCAYLFSSSESSFSDERERYIYFGGSILFFLIIWVLFLEVNMTYIEIKPDRIEKYSIWKGSQYCKWEEIESIDYDPLGHVFIFENKKKEKISISPFLSNLNKIENAIREKVYPSKWPKEMKDAD